MHSSRTRSIVTAPQTLALRGSDNQRLVLLTPLGRERFAGYDRPADARDRSVDVMFDENGEVWLAGIPARDDFRRLQRVLQSAGARVSISEETRAEQTRRFRNDPPLPQLPDREAAHRAVLRGHVGRENLPLGLVRRGHQRARRPRPDPVDAARRPGAPDVPQRPCRRRR